MNFKASYLNIDKQDFLQKIEQAYVQMRNCSLCANFCNVDRAQGKIGRCRAGKDVEVACWQIHRGEEPPLADIGGAGAIFFAHCNFKCVYCQNFQISQQQFIGKGVSPEQLAAIMLKLQNQGAQNIDLVTPTHFLAQIIEAIYLAKERGLCLPIVYNTNAYESTRTLQLLSGIVDIYMPDFKYFNDDFAFKYSGIKNYTSTAMQAIKLMYEQVGEFMLDTGGRACRGLLIRHLVLPRAIAGSFEVLDFLKQTTGVNIGLSIMSQYSPCYLAHKIDELNRKVDANFYAQVIEYVEKLGFEQCWIQQLKSSDVYLPDFKSDDVFKTS